jgi:hypothetical protein
VACALLAIPIARASADETSRTAYGSDRSLEGHVFQVSNLVPGPFALTEFGSQTSLGSGNAHASEFTLLNKEFGNATYPLIAFGQNFDFGIRLNQDMGLRFSFGGNAYTGSSGIGVIVAGTVATFSLGGAFLWGHTWGSVRVAGVLEGGLRPGFSILVANAIIDAVNNGQLRDNSALSSTEALYAAPGVSVAWAASPVFGVIGEARYLWTRQEVGVDTQSVRQGYILSTSLDFSLQPLIHWPIGLQGVTRLETRFNDSGVNRQLQYGGAIYYTDRVPLQLGLEVVGVNGELRRETNPSLTITGAIANIVLRYFW